ncbi:hypothetical protein HHL19_20610 [Streptomyces sp. R302]|uniref:hypothetical protein n=1 Tax=unclassified Streptomyces TaxID=2593676 RepID=UPI00145D9C70|nr:MULTISPECIES: hypothetical protein [unclassified Streptomyces]NML50910.1 hypothetical protein [Streptomyces sp. R301]NML81004.1 hypothetical protein [Streptomyces sp. R302]
MPATDPPTPLPTLGTYLAEDTTEGTPRLGRVTAWDGSLLHLQPPGGGTEWTAAPAGLRRPSERESALIRILTRPVTAMEPPPAPQTWPEPPVVLSAEPPPPALPAPGCAPCALAAEWERHHRHREDHSAAADCRVEIRNHPHTTPKLTLPDARP